MLLALDYLYSKSIVHGDVKPGNIFVASVSGKLVTFKLAEVRLKNAVNYGSVNRDCRAPEAVFDLEPKESFTTPRLTFGPPVRYKPSGFQFWVAIKCITFRFLKKFRVYKKLIYGLK